ncbi:MFS transporter [Thalassobaculum sp. OXR-137]|uniref:MFS transporter n=1 Tax=Thalassobaculum sp. OXR-137 TaxID=3100173 RepID=UPI002AC96CF5|nr:MFS transporter [Thalassobaculum sp. OXR-137]WPZ32255.1 MFS transporter [Thalassobaculum sp. OXR-137]
MSTATTGAAGTLSPRQVLWSLLAHYLSSMAIGLAVGGFVPLIAVTLEARQVDTVMIGINSAMTSLGVLAMAPYATVLVRRFGASPAMVAGLLLTAASALAMAFIDNLWAWMVLRFLIGAGISIHWVVSETWMNAIVSERRRGLVMSIYITSIASGFALGPIILTVVGTAGATPFVTVAAITALTALPMALIHRFAPALALETKGSVVRLAREAPTIFAAVLTVGLVDAAFFTFLPIYGLRIGMPSETAITLLTAVFAGNVALQVPLGWIADRVNRRGMLLVLGTICVVCPGLAGWLLRADSLAAYPILFVWGGCSFGLYTVGVTMLGERYRGGELVAANAAFVMTFELANLLGPPISGWAIEAWVPTGLMLYMACIAAGFVLVSLIRGWMRASGAVG